MTQKLKKTRMMVKSSTRTNQKPLQNLETLTKRTE